MVRKNVTLKKLRLDGDTQPRASIDDDLVAEYAAAYIAGAKIPPVIVFFDGTDHWLADGFHRWHAAAAAKMKSIRCDARKGTREDARWFSYSANQTHGLRRSNEDKAKAVKAALKHPKGAKLSDSKIGEHVGVDHKTVAKHRANLVSSREIPKIETRKVNRGNQEYEQDTTNIGRKPKEEKEAEPTCPTCNSTDFDDDGSCAKCHEPDVVEFIDKEEGPTEAQIEDARDALSRYVHAAIESWLPDHLGATEVDVGQTLRSIAEQYQ